MIQYCRKRGKELKDNAEFCDSCGFELNGNITKENAQESASNSKPVPTKMNL